MIAGRIVHISRGDGTLYCGKRAADVPNEFNIYDPAIAPRSSYPALHYFDPKVGGYVQRSLEDAMKEQAKREVMNANCADCVFEWGKANT